jgi:hypothetical protein
MELALAPMKKAKRRRVTISTYVIGMRGEIVSF